MSASVKALLRDALKEPLGVLYSLWRFITVHCSGRLTWPSCNTVILTYLLICLQSHMMKTDNPLRPVAVVKEGKENKDFLSALAA